MAQLPPDGTWLVQQESGTVSVFHRYTEETIARFNPGDPASVALAFAAIGDAYELLTDEQASFAYFWAGYFAGYAFYPPPEEGAAVSYDKDSRQVLLALGGTVHAYDAGDRDATARAQQVIYDSPLASEAKPMAHFWCGYFWATAGGEGD